MVTLTPSCADLVSPLWPTRWPWDGRLRTGCRATSPRPSGSSLRRYVLSIPGLGVGSCGSGQFRGASDSQGTWALHVAQCLFFSNLISLGSVSGLGFPDNLSGVGTALGAPWIRAPLSSAALRQAQVGSSHWTRSTGVTPGSDCGADLLVSEPPTFVWCPLNSPSASGLSQTQIWGSPGFTPASGYHVWVLSLGLSQSLFQIWGPWCPEDFPGLRLWGLRVHPPKHPNPVPQGPALSVLSFWGMCQDWALASTVSGVSATGLPRSTSPTCSSARSATQACSSPPGLTPMTAWTARAWKLCAGTTAP